MKAESDAGTAGLGGGGGGGVEALRREDVVSARRAVVGRRNCWRWRVRLRRQDLQMLGVVAIVEVGGSVGLMGWIQ